MLSWITMQAWLAGGDRLGLPSLRSGRTLCKSVCVYLKWGVGDKTCGASQLPRFGPQDFLGCGLLFVPSWSPWCCALSVSCWSPSVPARRPLKPGATASSVPVYLPSSSPTLAQEYEGANQSRAAFIPGTSPVPQCPRP